MGRAGVTATALALPATTAAAHAAEKTAKAALTPFPLSSPCRTVAGRRPEHSATAHVRGAGFVGTIAHGTH
jgi:hypothetical protein